jgi:hypothetical protein
MSEATGVFAPPSLRGWLLRDAILTAVFAVAMWILNAWHLSSGFWAVTVLCTAIGFIAGYALCYVYHEWGHLLAARLSGGHMPLAPYSGPIIGKFDIADHSRRQFIWLSWGGVVAYTATMVIAVAVYASGRLGLSGAGFAVGALAFVAQSLSVDLPQIWRVTRGADIAATSAAGANAQIILRRTWQSWTVLAILLVTWNLLR